jgi:hypothetical protein
MVSAAINLMLTGATTKGDRRKLWMNEGWPLPFELVDGQRRRLSN